MMQKSLCVCRRLVTKLHTFRAEFDNIQGKVAQDVHLSWMFFANRKDSGNATIANAMPALGANDFHTSESEVEQDASTNQTCNVSGTRFCTSSEDEGEWDLASGEQESPTIVPAKRRRYSKRGSRWGIKLLGEGVCRRAAQALVGVGTQRLQRIRRGDADGREADAKPLGGQLTMLRQSCMTFLWHSYHQVGEVMPDRFSFASQGGAGVFISVQGDSEEKVAWGRAPPGALDYAANDSDMDVGERESRAIAAATAACSSRSLPDAKAAFGPGMGKGPRRYLPPCKKIHLWWEYRALQLKENRPAASYHTFLRVWGQAFREGTLRIRKLQGMHAVCAVCAGYKKELRNAIAMPLAREQTLRLYTDHLVFQWLDRQVHDRMRDMSETCMANIASKNMIAALAPTSSVLTMIVDGIDQAKFRMPRQKVRSHAFDRLLRPALHVQGAWAHGAGYHLAVSDADCKKDTVANCDVIARMLENIYKRYGSVPMGLHVQQDNTSRECKNQKMLKFAIGLVSLGVFRWVTLAFMVTGHTHNPLDGTYGEIVVKLSHSEFDDDKSCIELLRRFVTELGIDEEARRHAWVYKHDEAAKWDDWWDQLELSFSNLTGPDAPHYFRVGLRSDVGAVTVPLPHAMACERCVQVTTPDANWPAAHPDDVVLVVKERMASLTVSQVLALVPANLRRRMLRSPMPQGLHPRRPGGEDVKKKCARVAAQLLREKVISSEAARYLIDWANGSLVREPRPAEYTFLRHRWREEAPGPCREAMRYDGGDGRAPCVRVSILGVSSEPLPVGEEPDEGEGELMEEPAALCM